MPLRLTLFSSFVGWLHLGFLLILRMAEHVLVGGTGTTGDIIGVAGGVLVPQPSLLLEHLAVASGVQYLHLALWRP